MRRRYRCPEEARWRAEARRYERRETRGAACCVTTKRRKGREELAPTWRARTIVPLRGIWAAQLRASTGKAVNTASFADVPRLLRSSCLQLRLIVVVCAKVAESWTETAILSPPAEPVPRRMTLVTSEPVLIVQEAGPGRVSRFCSQV